MQTTVRLKQRRTDAAAGAEAQKRNLTSSEAQPATREGSRDQEIAARAYQLYEERGREDGYALNDWLQAEREYPRVL